MESLETIDDICDNLRQLLTSFECNWYRWQESINNYDPNAINSVLEKYKDAPIPADNKWNAPLFPPSNNKDRPAQTTATHFVPDEKYRELTQLLDQIRGLYNELQNNQENETKKMTQRIDNIEKGLETNKEDIAQTKESVTTVCAGVESLQISVPKLEERVATVENTNATIIQLLQKAKKRAEKDKEDI